MNSPQLKSARAAKGLTQKECAAYLGVSLSTLTKWEGGAPIPPWVNDKMGHPAAQISVRDLTASEVQAFAKSAASKGLTGDQLAAELIRHWMRLPCILLGLSWALQQL